MNVLVLFVHASTVPFRACCPAMTAAGRNRSSRP
jgi:hypothetical protein